MVGVMTGTVASLGVTTPLHPGGMDCMVAGTEQWEKAGRGTKTKLSMDKEAKGCCLSSEATVPAITSKMQETDTQSVCATTDLTISNLNHSSSSHNKQTSRAASPKHLLP